MLGSGYENVPSPGEGCGSQLKIAGARGPSALANRSGGLPVPPSNQTLRSSSACGRAPRGRRQAQAAPLLWPHTERGTAHPSSRRKWVPTSDGAPSRPALLPSSAGPTLHRGTFNPNGLLAPSDLSSGPVAHPHSPLPVSPPGICPGNPRHGALTARAVQEGEQGPRRGTGASRRDTRKGAHGPKPRSLPPHRDGTHSSRGVHGSLPTGSGIT